MESYLDLLNKDILINIISRLPYDLTSISDVIHLKNSDFMRLCSMLHPKLFPTKFKYGDTNEGYDWRNLYINFLNEGTYPIRISTGYINRYDIFERHDFNLDITLFLFLNGIIYPEDIKDAILKRLSINANDFSHFYYQICDFIAECVTPYIFRNLFEPRRLRNIPGSYKLMSAEQITEDSDIECIFTHLLEAMSADLFREISRYNRKISPKDAARMIMIRNLIRAKKNGDND